MIDAMKYRFWYHISHYHKEQMSKIIAKQSKYLDPDKDPKGKFRKLGFNFLHHVEEFDRIQKKLDTIKERICEKDPTMRDGA